MTQHTELVARLHQEADSVGVKRAAILREAAAAIEALTAENERLRENRDKLNHAYREGHMKGREDAASGIDAFLRQEGIAPSSPLFQRLRAALRHTEGGE